MPPTALAWPMRLALYQPDIPQNTGTILRLAACLGVPVDVIGPTGFDMTDRALKRAALDYLAHVDLERHQSFAAFERRAGRAARAWSCSPPTARRPTPFRLPPPRIRCCWAAKAPACRRRCMTSPTPACASPSSPACARSTWRWRQPWCSARRCARPVRDHPPLDGEGGEARTFACRAGWGEAAHATPAAYPHP